MPLYYYIRKVAIIKAFAHYLKKEGLNILKPDPHEQAAAVSPSPVVVVTHHLSSFAKIYTTCRTYIAINYRLNLPDNISL